MKDKAEKEELITYCLGKAGERALFHSILDILNEKKKGLTTNNEAIKLVLERILKYRDEQVKQILEDKLK